MEVNRALRIEALRDRIERSDYHVDAEKVAMAILARPTTRLWLNPSPARPPQPPPADDVAFGQPAA